MKQAQLEALRDKVLHLERGSSRIASDRFATGAAEIDAVLRGGLVRGALHEIFAARTINEPSASGFAITLALRAAGKKPILWVRQDFAAIEMGEVYAPGLAELGLSPDRLILVRARDGPAVLKAAEEAARCPPLGAVLVEPWGNPKALDLAASRRLALAAATSNVPLLMARAAAIPAPSAAATKWKVSAAPSAALEADAPGHPAFSVTLLRDRAGASRRSWIVEWDRDNRVFRQPPQVAQGAEALSLGMVPLPADGSRDEAGQPIQHAH